jgi:DNA-binding MarR family transcriptional regulator
MSRKRASVAAAGPNWLTDEQQRAWLAYIRIQLRLSYEMNRQLQTDSNLSLADYDVLVALSGAQEGRMQVTALAAQIGWERSRLSHHARRMSKRGLVHCELAATDRRATDISLTEEGWRAIDEAAAGHVDLVRRLFFGGLPKTLIAPLATALEGIYDNILKEGSLPPPDAGPSNES